MKKIIFFMVALVAFCVSAAITLATDAGLVIQPEKMEIKAEPGNKIKREFVVVNRSNFPVRMKVATRDYKAVDERGKLEFYDGGDQAASRWLVPEFKEFSLSPLQSKVIQFFVVVPENALSGGNFAAILLEPAGGENIGPKGTFGLLNLITVVGGGGERAATGGEIINFSVSKFQGGDPAEISLNLKGLGNTHLGVAGQVTVKNWQNKEIAVLSAGDYIVYPGMNREIRWSWKNDLPWGFYRSEIKLFNKNKPDQIFSANDWFIIFPWQAIASSVGIFLLIIWLWPKLANRFLADKSDFGSFKIATQKNEGKLDKIYSAVGLRVKRLPVKVKEE